MRDLTQNSDSSLSSLPSLVSRLQHTYSSHQIDGCNCCHSVDGKTICVIDPAYEDQVKEKVNEVFSFLGESGVNSLLEKIKAVLEDDKMVRVGCCVSK